MDFFSDSSWHCPWKDDSSNNCLPCSCQYLQHHHNKYSKGEKNWRQKRYWTFQKNNFGIGWRSDSNWGICDCLCTICLWGINWWVKSLKVLKLYAYKDWTLKLDEYLKYLFTEYAGILLQLKVRVSVKKPQSRKINSRRASCEDQVSFIRPQIFFK